MTNKRKILYVEDMKECYEKTNETLGKTFDIDWKNNYSEALNAITKNLGEYSAAVFDVNLDYKPDLPDDKQTREGLDLIKILKKEAERQGISIPIICASVNGALYEPLSIKAGADKFLWKKEFWEGKGKEALEELVKKV
jgi:CheY-like chemotaxis protein